MAFLRIRLCRCCIRLLLSCHLFAGNMKKVTDKEWREKAANLTKWREKRTSPPNLDLYRKIVSMVHVGKTVYDVGCGQKHLRKCLLNTNVYTGIDPFPLDATTYPGTAEDLAHPMMNNSCQTVFMLSALDNVKDLSKALYGLRNAASENIVILTGIGIPPDQNHTVQIDRADLVEVLGEPTQEVEMAPKLFLFEWTL
jgi:hypothetical protein